jgi:hypothetical protein
VDPLLLPDDAIIILRQAIWQPDARRFLEMMTGAFWWTDELVQEIAHLCVARGNWSFRYLMGYRASVIRGKPEERFRPVWDQVARECPDWPGLRPERNCVSLATELHREGRKKCIEFLRLEREIQKRNLTGNPFAAPDDGGA